MGGARGPGSSGDLLVEVGTKLVAPLERSPVPGERQLDRQRQEPGAHPREGVKRGAVAGVRAGTGEQRIGGVETHRLKPGSHSSDAVPRSPGTGW